MTQDRNTERENEILVALAERRITTAEAIEQLEDNALTTAQAEAVIDAWIECIKGEWLQ